MDEVTYYPEARCEVQAVVPPLDRIAELRDVDGRCTRSTFPGA